MDISYEKVNALSTSVRCLHNWTSCLNSFSYGDAYVRQLAGSPLVKTMIRCLFGAKPLPIPRQTFLECLNRNISLLQYKFYWSVSKSSNQRKAIIGAEQVTHPSTKVTSRRQQPPNSKNNCEMYAIADTSFIILYRRLTLINTDNAAMIHGINGVICDISGIHPICYNENLIYSYNIMKRANTKLHVHGWYFFDYLSKVAVSFSFVSYIVWTLFRP